MTERRLSVAAVAAARGRSDCVGSAIRKDELMLEGHANRVTAVSFNSQSTRIATAGDNNVKVWDLASRKVLFAINGFKRDVFGIAFSQDGSRIFTCGSDETAKVWDANNGEPLAELKTGFVKSAAPVSTARESSPKPTRGSERFGTRRRFRNCPGWRFPKQSRTIEPVPTADTSSHFDANRVELVPLMIDQDELEYRLRKTQPRGSRHREGYLAARATADDFAAAFYFKLVPEAERKLLIVQADANAIAAMSKLAVERSWTDPDAALPLRLEILRIQKSRLPTDDPAVLEAMSKLGELYSRLHQFDKAVPLLEEVSKTHKAKLGVKNPRTINSIRSLGVAYKDSGRYADAIRVFEEGGEANPGLMPFLIETYTLAGEHGKVVTLLLKQLPEAHKSNPAEAQVVTDMLSQLGRAYLAQKIWTEAEPYLREFITVREKLGINDWRRFNAESMLGGALLGQKKYAGAEPLMVKGYEGMKDQRKFMAQEMPQASAVFQKQSID